MFCAVLAIWGRKPGLMIVHWIFKPMTTVLIIFVASLMVTGGDWRGWVLTALVWSLCGDVVLMFGRRWFALGLSFFLCAQACWAISFT